MKQNAELTAALVESNARANNLFQRGVEWHHRFLEVTHLGNMASEENRALRQSHLRRPSRASVGQRRALQVLVEETL